MDAEMIALGLLIRDERVFGRQEGLEVFSLLHHVSCRPEASNQ